MNVGEKRPKVKKHEKVELSEISVLAAALKGSVRDDILVCRLEHVMPLNINYLSDRLFQKLHKGKCFIFSLFLIF